MKKIFSFFFAVLFTLHLLGQSSQAAEIYFSQDTLLPNKIYITVKLLSDSDTYGLRDSIAIDCGDRNNLWLKRSALVKVPTQIFSIYNATYSGAYLYDPLYLDSTIVIGCVPYDSRGQQINIGGRGSSSESIQTYINAVINFKMLRNMRGYKSPYYNSNLFILDTVNYVLSYSPQIVAQNSFTIKVTSIIPLQAHNTNVPGFINPNNVYPAGPNTIFACDSSTGLLIWDYPSAPGLYDMATIITQSYNDTLVSSVIQDLNIVIVASNTEGVSDISNTLQFLCYPNPTSGAFTIDMTSYGEGEKDISVYNGLGCIVGRYITDKQSIVVSNILTQGFYYVEVNKNSKRAYRCLVVQ